MDSSDDFVYDPDALDYDYDEEEVQEMKKRNFPPTIVHGLMVLQRSPKMDNLQLGNDNDRMDTDQPQEAVNDSMDTEEADQKGDVVVAATNAEKNGLDEEGSEAGPSSKRVKLAPEPATDDAKSVGVAMEPKNEAGELITPNNVESSSSTETEIFGVASVADAEMPHLVAIRPRRKSRSWTCHCCENYGKPPKLNRP